MGKSRAVFALVAAFAAAAQAATIFQDNFESYTSDADVRAAGAWGDLGSNVSTQFGLAGVGNPGQSMYDNGNSSTNPDAVHKYAATPATIFSRLVIEFDYCDYNTGSADRMTLGIRNSTGTGAGGFFELGEYNALDADPDNNGNTTTVQGYGFRTVFVGGPGDVGGWVPLTTSKVVSVDTDADTFPDKFAWHHFKMIITDSWFYASVKVDTDLDGVPDTLYERQVPLSSAGGKTYDSVRFGGPSNISSTGTGLLDNLVIYTEVPEPASLVLVGLSGLFLSRRRRLA